MIGQSLYTIKFYLEMMGAGIKEGTRTGEDMIRTITSEVLIAIKELNNVAMNLRPAFLEDMDIGDALRWYGNAFREMHRHLRVSAFYAPPNINHFSLP